MFIIANTSTSINEEMSGAATITLNYSILNQKLIAMKIIRI